MRRNMVLVAATVALLGACGKGGNGKIVATADKEDLSVEWVADVVHSAKGMQPSIKASAWLADLWIDLSLFAQASAANKLTDSTTISEAMWFNVLKFRLAHWHDSLLAERVKITPAELDSAAKAMDMRYAQHILISTMGGGKAEEAAAKAKIEGILAKAKGGADFGQLATDNSDDGSKMTKGWLGVATQATYVPEFSKALWELKPGAISGVVKTQFGYHIIRRGSDAESDSLIRAAVKDSLMIRSGAGIAEAYLKELTDSRKFEVKADAPGLVKAALLDLSAKRNDKTKLATFDGGQLTVADFVRWLNLALADPQRGMDMKDNLAAAPDSVLSGFVNELGRNEILAAVATEHKIGITADEWTMVKAEYMDGLDTLNAHMGLTTLDPSLTGGARATAAAAKVMDYFKRIQSKETNLMAPPGQLTWVLRGRYKVKIYPDGLQRSVDLATAQNAADSTGAPAGPPPVVEPATGGPPVGGGGTTPPPPATTQPRKP